MDTHVQLPLFAQAPYVPPPVRSLVSHAKFGALHAAGDLRLLDKPGVAVVGSRKASPDALEAAARVGAALVDKGFVVISGLAAGVDVACQQSAMAAGGRTIGVIGTSLNRSYPASHAALQKRVYEEHLLVSPFSPSQATAPWSFPVRDRVIARLSRATVLVAAEEKSGTRHVVEECIRQSKQVFARKGLLERLSWLKRAAGRGEVIQWDAASEILRAL
jgi:DNA processing protein